MSREDIEAYLSATEHEAGISILGAWNTGSRAWGLNDAESDYDLAFVFTQPFTNYATDTGYIDSFDLSNASLDEGTKHTSIPRHQIEGQGWDIGNFTNMLFDNNPAALEALLSPMTYRPHPTLQELETYMRARFNSIEAHNHYQSMGTSIYEDHIEDGDGPLKQTIMAARSCMYATYIRDTHEFPELHFPTFIEEERERFNERWDISAIETLIQRKQDGDGDAIIGNPHQAAIEASLDDGITNYKDHIRPEEERMRKEDLADLMSDLLDSRTLLK